jgi:hypothetical protein
MLQKKEGGNLTVRDYTDDVYNKPNIGAAQFIEGMREGIVQFTNLLCVVPRAKFQLFQSELNTVMTEYYDNMD